MSSNLESLIRAASEVENTPELRKYWERRYQQAQDKNLYRINQKTLELFTSNQPILKPATTYADILLVSHLDSQQRLQENQLQDTIETVVRLLDALLDKINFNDQARGVINQHRKIAIGLGDLPEYLQTTGQTENQETIDYLGGFVSGKAYRASESLAEEKGPCQSWKQISRQLRPKSFEFWYNRQDGEIRSGLELSEEFDQESILDSNFEIIPRRNSHLLLYPQTEAWQSWSDRQASSISKPEAELQPRTEDTPAIIPTDTLEGESPFQVGELVQINNSEHPRDREILQIVDILTSDDGETYRLSDGQKETEDEIWQADDLQVVELGQVLDKLNSVQKQGVKTDNGLLEVWARVLLLNSDKTKVWVTETNDLPGIKIQKNQLPEKALLKYLAENYQFVGQLDPEVGSGVTLDEQGTQPSLLHLGFTAREKNLSGTGQVNWLSTDSDKLPDYARILLSKLRTRQVETQELQDKLDFAIAKQREMEQLLEAEEGLPEEVKAQAHQISDQTTHRQYKPEVVANTLGSLSKYVLKLEQLLQTQTFGEMLLTLTYDGHGPRIVNLDGQDLPAELRQTLEMFLELINFILTNDIDPRYLSKKLGFAGKEHIHLPIKQLLQFVGHSLQLAPERVQEINTDLIENIDDKNLNKIKNRDILKTDLQKS